MDKYILPNTIRAIAILALQVLVFKQLSLQFGNFAYIHFFIYPLIIFLLPFKFPKPLILLIAFFIGAIIDLFYDSPGVHAGALVFTAYMRGFVSNFLEPFEGYNVNDNPSPRNLGIQWFFLYSSILLGLHMFFYFSLEYFSFVFYFDILMNSVFSFIASYIVIILFVLIFKPK